jgi:hypothetical protein
MSAHRDLADLTDDELEARRDRLDEWPTSTDDALNHDPRCGCDPDCDYDSIAAIESEMLRRYRADPERDAAFEEADRRWSER